MHKETWKAVERRIAAFFGARRVLGSGSLGRDDRTRSDSTHDIVYVECKSRQKIAAITLWADAAQKARAEGKPLVVVALHAVSRKEPGGDFLLVRSDQFDALAAERAKALEANPTPVT
jgi:hypothetical protein